MADLSRSFSATLIAAVSGLLATASTATAASVDFETAGDLANGFFLAVSGGTGTESFVEANGVGVGNPASRGLDTFATGSNYDTAIHDVESFPINTVGSRVSVSLFAKRLDDTNPSNASSSFVRLAITSGATSNNDRITGGNGYAFGLDVFHDTDTATGTGVIFRTAKKNDGGASLATIPGVSATLTAGDWYKVSVDFENVGSNTIRMTGLLENYGPDGLATPSTVATIGSQDFVNASLAGDSSVFGAFVARQDGGSDAVDNFTAVPEPASMGVLAVGALGLLARRRRTT